MASRVIVKILNEAYEGEHTWHHIEKDIETLLEQIKNYLDSKEATIASVGGDMVIILLYKNH